MNFNQKLILSSVILLALSIGWNFIAPEQFHSRFAFLIVIYFFLLTFLMHRYVMKAGERSAQAFVRAYIGTTSLRMLFHIVFVLVYGVLDKPGFVPFVIAFIPAFIFYLIFEIVSYQRSFRQRN